MRLQSMILVAVLGLAPAVLAQQPRSPERPRWHGQRPPGPGAMLDRMSERMVQTLNLTPEQAEQLTAITDEFRPRFEQGTSTNFRELAHKLSEARASGDEQQIAAAEAELEQARSAQQKLMGEFMDRVETILTPDQKERLADIRSRFSGAAHRSPRDVRMIESLPEELQLTADQRQKFDALEATWRTARDDQRTQMRSLAQELREAQKAGHEKRVKELREQLEQLRSAPSATDVFYTDLEKVLTDQQKAKLAEIRATSGEQGVVMRVRNVVRAAERLELTKEQSEAVREIARKAMHELRQAKPGERAEVEAQIAERTKTEITALLTPEQVPQFEQALKNHRPQRAPHHRGARPPAKKGAAQTAPKQP